MIRRVLIVEDGYGDRMILRDFLISLGYQVVGEAKNSDEFLEKYEKLKPDLVLLDIAIPEHDGVSAVIKLRRIDPEAKVLVCISRGQRALAMEAMSAGALDFVMKPFNLRHLHRTIRNAA